MKGIILASHGRLAEGMLDTLKYFQVSVSRFRHFALWQVTMSQNIWKN